MAVQNCSDLGLSKPWLRSAQRAFKLLLTRAARVSGALTFAYVRGSLYADTLRRYRFVPACESGGTRHTFWQLVVTALTFELAA
mmetsp:Transcript_3770/g.5382  ORF Transcript_3770/g.5382 Transcript_3770/m.5382 type:complete len:84 (+) Transcript_3770:1-252(+)